MNSDLSDVQVHVVLHRTKNHRLPISIKNIERRRRSSRARINIIFSFANIRLLSVAERCKINHFPRVCSVNNCWSPSFTFSQSERRLRCLTTCQNDYSTNWYWQEIHCARNLVCCQRKSPGISRWNWFAAMLLSTGRNKKNWFCFWWFWRCTRDALTRTTHSEIIIVEINGVGERVFGRIVFFFYRCANEPWELPPFLSSVIVVPFTLTFRFKDCVWNWMANPCKCWLPNVDVFAFFGINAIIFHTLAAQRIQLQTNLTSNTFLLENDCFFLLIIGVKSIEFRVIITIRTITATTTDKRTEKSAATARREIWNNKNIENTINNNIKRKISQFTYEIGSVCLQKRKW